MPDRQTSASTAPTVHPFLKWAGGKRWLVDSHSYLFPDSYNRYIEPFLGSGAVFFHLAPTSAILSDSNPDLVESYLAIKTNWRSVERLLALHHRKHSREYYYIVRGVKPRTAEARAARFIYLNRTCWNGLYRVNKDGHFNVPKGSKESVILDTDDFSLVSKLLHNAKIVSCDFEETISQAQSNDFLFVDPPYTVNHSTNGFIKYNEKIFSWADQLRLKDALLSAARRGAKVILTNASHASTRKLYDGLGNKLVLTRSSVIAADSKRRGDCFELLIRSWK